MFGLMLHFCLMQNIDYEIQNGLYFKVKCAKIGFLKSGVAQR